MKIEKYEIVVCGEKITWTLPFEATQEEKDIVHERVQKDIRDAMIGNKISVDEPKKSYDFDLPQEDEEHLCGLLLESRHDGK